jgi:hypothetical protein
LPTYDDWNATWPLPSVSPLTLSVDAPVNVPHTVAVPTATPPQSSTTS